MPINSRPSHRLHSPHLALRLALAGLLMSGCQKTEEPEIAPEAKGALYQCLDKEPGLAKSASTQADSTGSASTDPIQTDGDSARDTARRIVIQDLRGFPPVRGMEPIPVKSSMNDSRTTSSPVLSSPSNSNIGWIEPVNLGSAPVLPSPCLALVSVATATSYHAKNVLLNSQCQVVREFEYDYATGDSLKTMVTYIAWDLKDSQQHYVAAGSYYWNIEVTAGEAKMLYRQRPNVMRSEACPLQ